MHAASLAAAGATAFRLNASHLNAIDLGQHLDLLNEACPGAPVVVDLQGAKMRAYLWETRHVAAGDRLRFAADFPCDARVPHRELFRQVEPGETLTVDDGRLRFRVLRVEGLSLVAEALNEGELKPRKGVNVEQHPVVLEGLTERDRESCQVASRHGVTTFAFSFMTDGREADWLRSAVPGCRVIGKVEQQEAAHRLSAIAGRVNAVWICRGDLGAQLGPAGLARFVASVAPSDLGAPVLMAGQVLEHLTSHGDPTRSEVCHLFDLVARGYAGIVLSDETAIGHAPAHAVAVAAGLLTAFRPSLPFQSL